LNLWWRRRRRRRRKVIHLHAVQNHLGLFSLKLTNFGKAASKIRAAMMLEATIACIRRRSDL